MNPTQLIEELFVFVGLMATLGCITKVILSVLHRRRAVSDGVAPLLTDITQRLARLEQAIDATAVEVERISEGQRFTTKLLSERVSSTRGADPPRGRVNTPN